MTGSEDIRDREVGLESGRVRLRAAAAQGQGVLVAEAACATREEAAVVVDRQDAARPDGPVHVHVAGRAAPPDGADVAPVAAGQRDQPNDLSVVAVRDLIAARLQDEAVRRIFAAGLTLESAAGLTEAPEVCRRIEAAIGELDQAIRDIRAAVFDAELGPQFAGLGQAAWALASGWPTGSGGRCARRLQKVRRQAVYDGEGMPRRGLRSFHRTFEPQTLHTVPIGSFGPAPSGVTGKMSVQRLRGMSRASAANHTRMAPAPRCSEGTSEHPLPSQISSPALSEVAVGLAVAGEVARAEEIARSIRDAELRAGPGPGGCPPWRGRLGGTRRGRRREGGPGNLRPGAAGNCTDCGSGRPRRGRTARPRCPRRPRR